MATRASRPSSDSGCGSRSAPIASRRCTPRTARLAVMVVAHGIRDAGVHSTRDRRRHARRGGRYSGLRSRDLRNVGSVCHRWLRSAENQWLLFPSRASTVELAPIPPLPSRLRSEVIDEVEKGIPLSHSARRSAVRGEAKSATATDDARARMGASALIGRIPGIRSGRFHSCVGHPPGQEQPLGREGDCCNGACKEHEHTNLHSIANNCVTRKDKANP